MADSSRGGLGASAISWVKGLFLDEKGVKFKVQNQGHQKRKWEESSLFHWQWCAANKQACTGANGFIPKHLSLMKYIH